MNVNDFTPELPPAGTICKLQAIFDLQHQLMEKYAPIEISNGFRKTLPPLNLHLAHHQAEIKDMAWRVTEELAEAHEAYLKMAEGVTEAKIHLVEELSDSLHFITELCLMVGVTPSMICPGYPVDFDLLDVSVAQDRSVVLETDLHSSFFMPIYQLGLAMNCLKNKPWKMSQMMTDVDYFHKQVVLAYQAMIGLFCYFERDSSQIYDIYFRKNAVNRFRQASNY